MVWGHHGGGNQHHGYGHGNASYSAWPWYGYHYGSYWDWDRPQVTVVNKPATTDASTDTSTRNAILIGSGVALGSVAVIGLIVMMMRRP